MICSQELAEIKERVKMIEEEAEKLKLLQQQQTAQMQLGAGRRTSVGTSAQLLCMGKDGEG